MMEFQIKQYGDVPIPRFGHSATAISNNSVIVFGGAFGDTGRYEITNECYLFSVKESTWTKLKTNNEPGPRAAHAATKVEEKQLVVYGGATGGGTLATEELYMLDLQKSETDPSWIVVPISGVTPGRRYGHSMIYSKPNLILFAGNDGLSSLNDIWYMNIKQVPFIWKKVEVMHPERQPVPRIYHTADTCREGPAQNMMVIFGGRTSDGQSLKDTWGLRQHRNGAWDWIQAPHKKGAFPESRFQHTSVFYKTKIFIIGGREYDLGKKLGTSIYDTETCEWNVTTTISRFRHASWIICDKIFIFGGFGHITQTHPTNDLNVIDLSQLDILKSSNKLETQKKKNLSLPNNSIDTPVRAPYTPNTERWVKLSQHVITKVDYASDFGSMVRKMSIDKLNEEGKKIRGHMTPLNARFALSHSQEPDETIEKVLRSLLNPNISIEMVQRNFNSLSPFSISKSTIIELLVRCIEILKYEEMVITLRAPIKIFGDIHGQYYDLMRLFGSYKSPIDECWFTSEEHEGDIDSNDYLFLGDFVDRGTNSLEVITLLLALKCKYPTQVHLIRGNHEDHDINSLYGFKDECRRRLNENTDSNDSAWKLFNTMFEYLPLAAVIENKIICLHGGLGSSINSIKDIMSIPKPLKVCLVPKTIQEQKVTDILWSDPTENDSMLGVHSNLIRDPEKTGFIVRYGPDRVVSFLENNNLDLLIRAHECVMDGFERFAGGRLITLFSATDYCNLHKNAGALLFVRRDLTIIPKVIFPPTRTVDLPLKSTWLQLDSRPPTPPRSSRKIKEW